MKKYYYKNAFLFLIGAIILSACQEPLESEYTRPIESLLLVEGKITTDTTSHYVYLTRTAALSETEIPVETGAKVTITNNETIIPLTELEAGSGKYFTAPDVYGEIGETYRLDIELSNGEKFYATTEIKRNTEIDSATMHFEVSEYNSKYFFHNIYFHGWELPEEGNAYVWNAYLNDTLYNDTLKNTHFESDEYVNGNYIGVESKDIKSVITGRDSITILVSNFYIYSIDPEDITTDTVDVVVEIESVPLDYYDFLVSLVEQTAYVGSPFDVNKADLLTNISGNALGFFYGASVDRYSFKYIPPKESKGFKNPESGF